MGADAAAFFFPMKDAVDLKRQLFGWEPLLPPQGGLSYDSLTFLYQLKDLELGFKNPFLYREISISVIFYETSKL